ncbi:MAG TPA: hypothetical protein VIJ99_05235, partial [Acidimicrobiales bacterium]
MKLGMRKIGVVSATAALVLSGVATFAATGASAAAKKAPKLKTYSIGYQGPLSGGNAATGLFELHGVQLAVKQWNANKKRKFNVKLVSGDDQGDPTIAPSVATG